MLTRNISNHLPLATAAATALILTACGDSTGPEEHPGEAAGFAIELDGTEVLRYLDSQGGTPVLNLDSGTTYEAAIVFLDEDGDPAPHEDEEPGAEEGLQMVIANGSLLVWEAEEHEEGEEGEFLEFHGELTTFARGTTTLQMCTLHEGHCDYETPVVNVSIN